MPGWARSGACSIEAHLGGEGLTTCGHSDIQVDPPFTSALHSEIALALSFSHLRQLYLPPSVLPSITVASLAKLAARHPLTPAAVLSIVDPLSDGTDDLFTKGTAVLLDVLQPATVVYNKLPFSLPVDASAMPTGTLDVLEGDSLEPFKLALASLPPPPSSPPSTSDETDTNIGGDVLVPEDRSRLYLQASTALDYLSCAHAAVRLQADELLIRKIKTCLFHMTHAREFSDDRVLGRAFEGDMRVCERAFERETLGVAIGVGADVRTFKAKRVDETLGESSSTDEYPVSVAEMTDPRVYFGSARVSRDPRLVDAPTRPALPPRNLATTASLLILTYRVSELQRPFVAVPCLRNPELQADRRLLYPSHPSFCTCSSHQSPGSALRHVDPLSLGQIFVPLASSPLSLSVLSFAVPYVLFDPAPCRSQNRM